MCAWMIDAAVSRSGSKMLGTIRDLNRRCEDDGSEQKKEGIYHTAARIFSISRCDMIRTNFNTRGFRSLLICKSLLDACRHTAHTCILLRQHVGMIGPNAADRRWKKYKHASAGLEDAYSSQSPRTDFASRDKHGRVGWTAGQPACEVSDGVCVVWGIACTVEATLPLRLSVPPR